MEVSVKDFLKKTIPTWMIFFAAASVFGRGYLPKSEWDSYVGKLKESPLYVFSLERVGFEDPQKEVGVFVNGQRFYSSRKDQVYEYSQGQPLRLVYRVARPDLVQGIDIELDGKNARKIIQGDPKSGATSIWSEFREEQTLEVKVLFDGGDKKKIKVKLKPKR